MVPWAHPRPQPKQHVSWLSRFSTARGCDKQSHRHTSVNQYLQAGGLIQLSAAILSLVCQVDASRPSVAHMWVSAVHVHSLLKAWLSQSDRQDVNHQSKLTKQNVLEEDSQTSLMHRCPCLLMNSQNASPAAPLSDDFSQLTASYNTYST